MLTKTQDCIESLREILQPSPVTLGQVPARFTNALRKARREAGYRGSIDAQSLLCSYESADVSWLDHWGSTEFRRGDRSLSVFVTEPYSLTPDSLQLMERIAEDADCRLDLNPNSWWNPGATFRVCFVPKEFFQI